MLPDSLRRPVEILGLFHLADIGAIDGNPSDSCGTNGDTDSQAAGPSERFDAIRADGSTRQFHGSRVPLRPADSSAPCAARGETHD
jgi:hypothetical protein